MFLRQVSVSACSSSANLGPGFDVLGVALKALQDKVTIEQTEKPGISIMVRGIDADRVPSSPMQNTAGLVALEVLHSLNVDFGLKMVIHKGVPVGSGLGSSAASAAATALALNSLFDLKLSSNKLVELASHGERASAGVAHKDNVSSSLLGGITIVRSQDPVEVISLKPPPNLIFSVVIPDVHYSTKEARTVIPRKIPLEHYVRNIGCLSGIIAGIFLKDVKMMGQSIQDCIIEPSRKHLIPGYDIVKKNALKAGASGIAISGAGPSMIAVVDKKKSDPYQVVSAMQEPFEERGIKSKGFVSEVGGPAKIVKRIR